MHPRIAVGVVLLIAGCVEGHASSKATPPDAGDGGLVLDGGDAGLTDYDALRACTPTPSCPASFIQQIENGWPTGNEGTTCLFEALRDRRPGLYLHGFNHAFTTGSSSDAWVLVIHADGTVTRARHGGTAERCTLQTPQSFMDCLDGIHTCSNATQWFWSCQPTSADDCDLDADIDAGS